MLQFSVFTVWENWLCVVTFFFIWKIFIDKWITLHFLAVMQNKKK